MKMRNTKLVLSALAIAFVATPAFAAKRHVSYEGLQNSTYGTATNPVGTYPNGAIRSGSVWSREMGNDDNVIR
jgi:hypothetical protein